MKPKLIIAVSATSVAAAAVIYRVNEAEPTFVFADSRGQVFARRLLSSIHPVPPNLKTLVDSNIKKTALSWAIVRMSDSARTYSMGLASARALERLRLQRPEVLSNLRFGEVQIATSSKFRLPEELVHLTPQQLEVHDWQVNAAAFLSKQAGTPYVSTCVSAM